MSELFIKSKITCKFEVSKNPHNIFFNLIIKITLKLCCDLTTFKMSELCFVVLGKEILRLRANKASFCPGKNFCQNDE